jgi:beta-galactosidase beta subunit
MGNKLPIGVKILLRDGTEAVVLCTYEEAKQAFGEKAELRHANVYESIKDLELACGGQKAKDIPLYSACLCGALPGEWHAPGCEA